MQTARSAYETVRDRLATGGWSPGERMPSLMALAEICHVSRGTMWKALSLLQKDGLVRTKKRGAIIAGPTPQTESDQPPRGLLWERTKTQLGKDILAGAFPGHFLPPVSKLARLYGVTAHTVSKSLEGLVREGLLDVEGLKYRETRTGSRGYQSPIVLISLGARDRGLLVSDLRTQSIVESFERECSRLGHTYRSVGYNLFAATALIDIESVIKDMRDAGGFVANIWNPWSETYWNRWLDLLSFLMTRGAPVVVIDQSGNLAFPRALTDSPHFRVLRIASVRAGVMVADFLFRRGHKRIAYLTPYFSLEWSKSRYEGLCQYYKTYTGPESRVEHYALSELADNNDLRLALLNLDKASLESLYGEIRTREEIAWMKRSLDRIAGLKLPRLFPADLVTTTLRSLSHALIKEIQTKHDPATCGAVVEAIGHLADEEAMRIYLSAFLESVLKESTSSAWVCSEERTAVNVLHFLRSRGKKVPRDISVFGFDNWREAYEQDLTTYDFNMDGIVKQALLMIMDKKILKSTAVISEVDGYVVERGTTRR